MKPKKAVAALSALAHESRLDIFRLLLNKGEEGMAAGALAEALQIPAATLSFHLSQLSGAGLIKSTKDGRSVIYRASYKRLKKLTKFLTEGNPKNLAGLETPGDESEAEPVHEIDII